MSEVVLPTIFVLSLPVLFCVLGFIVGLGVAAHVTNKKFHPQNLMRKGFTFEEAALGTIVMRCALLNLTRLEGYNQDGVTKALTDLLNERVSATK